MARVTGDGSETNNNFNTANGTGSAVRGKLNEILTALRTINAGTNDPSGAANVVQFQPHINNNVLKICTAVDSDGNGTFTTIGDITNDNLGLLPVDGTNPMTGNLQLANGSASSPSINVGDSNTGLYKYTANHLGVAAAGVDVAVFSSDGVNVQNGKHLILREPATGGSDGIHLSAPAIDGGRYLVLPPTTGAEGQAITVQAVNDLGGGNTQAVLQFSTVAASGGGVVKNIVQTVYSQSAVLSCNNIVTGQSFIDVTGMSLNITPQDAGNKILVEFDLNLMIRNTSIFYINLVRTIGSTSTILALPNSPSGSDNANKRATQIVSTQSSGSTHFRTPCSFKFLDTPNTTSQVTYKLMIGTNNTDSNYRVAFLNREIFENVSFSSSQIMATEYDI